MTVQHYTGPLTEETSYYPFGLAMGGISSKAVGRLENKKKFNGYEEKKDFDLNWLESFYRTYDPQLGRWWQVDPKPTDLESPYAAMRNNPVRHYDILGDTLGPDNNNYMMDYQPVFSAPSVGEGVLNFFGNLGTLLYNSTAGLAMTTAQTLGNITVGMINSTYKSPGSPMALFDQWQTEAYRYHTQTPLRQQVADFFAVATDPRSYEILPAMALGLRLPRAPSVPMQSLKSGGQFKGSSLRPTETKGVDIVGTGFNKVLPTQDYINPLKVAE